METTTIKIYGNTKAQLDLLREYKNESYDEVIKKILYIVNSFRKKPELGKETIDAIEKARNRIRRGQFLTESEAKKRLGL
ncbi:hypothetical protein HY837_02615 [archaeon]|nr:hypothetical protein [archaeon]